jgi:hypothetical protein
LAWLVNCLQVAIVSMFPTITITVTTKAITVTRTIIERRKLQNTTSNNNNNNNNTVTYMGYVFNK